MDRPHLLYVAWGFPPSRGAGMYRARATANAFARSGWRVTVLTPPREVFELLTGIDETTEASVDPAIRIVRVPFRSPRLDPELSSWSRFRASAPLAWSALQMLRDRRGFPENVYGRWRPELLRATEDVHATDPVSLVIGTANPNIDFLPGYELNRRHGVPHVMDYRDTWHLDVYSGRRRGTPRSRSARWERRLLASAREAWFVNDAIRDWHASQYPESASRFRVVANGYDPEFIDAPVTPRQPRPLTLGYLGTVYGPMPLEETLEGWRLARRLSPLVADARFVWAGQLGHYAVPESRLVALLDSYRDDGVSYVGPVPKAQVAEAYAEFDALALILGRSRYVTSGKVFEYAATGLPIVSLHAPETASTEVLRGRPGWFATPDLRVESIANAIIDTLTAAATTDEADRRDAYEWSTHLERDRQLAPRIAELTEAAS